MPLFDDLLKKAGAKAQNAVQSGLNQAKSAASDAVRSGIRSGVNAAANAAHPSPASQAAEEAGARLNGSGVSVTTGQTAQGYPSVTVSFDALPASLEELKACPLSDLRLPYGTAALTLAALNRWEEDRSACHAMLNLLRGPRPMSPMDEQFLRDRLAGKMYVVRSYWAGTSPENGYAPELPYRVTFFEDPYTWQPPGYCRLSCVSSGADSPRQIMLRKKESTGEWFLWENYLLPDIRIPAEADPWA